MADQLIITDANYRRFVPHPNAPDGDAKYGRGYVPRDYSAVPIGGYGSGEPWADSMDLIPMEQWPDLIADQARNKSRISDIRNIGDDGQPIAHLDQNGQGFCWMYDPVMAMMLLRAIAGLPHVRLSAHAAACKVKNFKDEGGWAALGLDFLVTHGCPSIDTWPEKSMSRRYDVAATWDEAKQYRITEGFMDLDVAAWDRDLSRQQVGTLLLSGIPVCGDFMWWGHSVCCMDLVDVHPDRPATDYMRYGLRIINSWANWGDNGVAVLSENKAWPDGAVAPRAVSVTAA